VKQSQIRLFFVGTGQAAHDEENNQRKLQRLVALLFDLIVLFVILSENEEVTNKIWQQTRLMEYFNEMPVIQLIVDNVEADDLISFVCRQTSVADNQKVIVSNDKDFFQI
jgi:5'-3' exonuclease